jgi:hypothetical protein
VKLIFLALLVIACDGSHAPDCAQIDASTCIGPPPSFQNDVLPILDRSCNQACHNGATGVWPLTQYQDVADWANLVGADLQSCSMPPVPESGPPLATITTAERATIMQWIACNVPNN